MKKMFKFGTALSLSVLFSTSGMAQCESWEAYPKGKDEAENQHVIYRGFFKAKEYDKAFPVWEELFQHVKSPKAAPRRHFKDGIKMYQERIKAEMAKKDAMDKEKKDADLQIMISLYDQMAECTGEKTNDRAYQGYYMNRFKADPLEQLKVMDKAIELGGNEVHHVIFSPYLNVAVWLYQTEKEGFDAEYIRNMHAKFKKIVDHNVTNKTKDAAKYEEKWAKWEQKFKARGRDAKKSLENEVFGCDYYVEMYTPLHEADPKNVEQNKEFMKMLKFKCGMEHELYQKMEAINDEIIAAAKRETWQKDFDEAKCDYVKGEMLDTKHKTFKEMTEEEKTVSREEAKKYYKEALDSDPDCIPEEKRADIAYSVGYDLYRAGSYSSARKYLRQASKFRPNWGKPYMLVGTMYAASGKRCDTNADDGVGQGPHAQVVVWVAMDEWNKAKSVDPSVAGEANSKISKYKAYLPTKGEVFQQNLGWKEGGSYTVGCWIQQSTKVRLRSTY